MKTKVEWVTQKEEARAFGSSVDALAYCVAAGLCEVRLVVSSGKGSDSFLYPFGEDRKVETPSVSARARGAARLLRKINRPVRTPKVDRGALAVRTPARSKPVLPP